MNWKILVSLFQDAFPLPSFTDGKAVGTWIAGMSDEMGEIIAELAGQYAKTGTIELELPTGEIVSCCDDDCICKLAAVDPKAWGDGKFLEFLIQILPFFLKKDPIPTPPPAPPVV